MIAIGSLILYLTVSDCSNTVYPVICNQNEVSPLEKLVWWSETLHQFQHYTN